MSARIGNLSADKRKRLVCDRRGARNFEVLSRCIVPGSLRILFLEHVNA